MYSKTCTKKSKKCTIVVNDIIENNLCCLRPMLNFKETKAKFEIKVPLNKSLS